MWRWAAATYTWTSLRTRSAQGREVLPRSCPSRPYARDPLSGTTAQKTCLLFSRRSKLHFQAPNDISGERGDRRIHMCLRQAINLFKVPRAVLRSRQVIV